MSDRYRQLLDATLQHVEGLKARGVRHLAVTPETLRALARAPSAAPKVSAAPLKPLGQVRSPATKSVPMQEIPLAAAVARSPAEKVAAYAALRERALACVRCPQLAASRQQVVFGAGSLEASILFVGEAPGAEEETQGEPFVGEAGQLFAKILQAAGLSRAEVYITTLLKCRPAMPGSSADNRKPTPEETAACLPYLHEQIDLIRPQVIVALGATAVEGLLGKTAPISKLRGQWQSHRGTPLMPTYHPAYLLRNPSLQEKRKVWEDLLQVMEKVGMPISDKQRGFFLKA